MLNKEKKERKFYHPKNEWKVGKKKINPQKTEERKKKNSLFFFFYFDEKERSQRNFWKKVAETATKIKTATEILR